MEKKLFQDICQIAIDAGDIALRYYLQHKNQSLHLSPKQDGTFFTQADVAVEQYINEHLLALTPDIRIISEEAYAQGDTGDGEDFLHTQFWLVDPIDGTRQFIDGLDEFTVNIGLVAHGYPQMGVIYLPVQKELYAAPDLTHAYKSIEGGSLTPIHAAPVDHGQIHLIHGRSVKGSPRLEAYMKEIGVASTDSMGSSIKFCMLAEGKGDHYPRLGPTMEWDTAAGQAILEAAGGCVLDVEGNRFHYGKPGFKNTSFLAWGKI